MPTRTGLLESHLDNVYALERLCRLRQQAHGEEDLSQHADEREIVDKVIRHAVGTERLIRRWIAIRIAREQSTLAVMPRRFVAF